MREKTKGKLSNDTVKTIAFLMVFVLYLLTYYLYGFWSAAIYTFGVMAVEIYSKDDGNNNKNE